jgi:hypothetical protein
VSTTADRNIYPNNGKLGKENVIHIRHGYYSAIKKNEIMSFARKWIELEIIMLSKISQVQKDKYYMQNLDLKI